MRPFPSVLLGPVVLLIGASVACATTWDLYPDGSGDWPTIQTAIDSAVAGDTVLLHCGTYYEHDVSLKSGIVLCSETGDPGCATIDGSGLGQVLLAEHLTGNTVVEGLTITGGNAPDVAYPHNKGAGMLVFHCSPTIRRCVFVANHATSAGGGIFLAESASRIEDCMFLENSTDFDGGGLYGFGGAIVARSYFRGNSAYFGGGAHLLSMECLIGFEDCVFEDNTASSGGGAVFCTDQAEPWFESCTFHDNWAYARGGAVYCVNYGTAELVSCTISDNSSQYGAGGVECWALASATLENTILAFSSSGASVFCDAADAITLICSDVYGNAGGDWVGCIASQEGTAGNLSANPAFCDRPARDYTLEAGSPCLAAPGCGLIGAWGEGCGGPTATESTSWGAIKRAFR